jgi:hypothetical protein
VIKNDDQELTAIVEICGAKTEQDALATIPSMVNAVLDAHQLILNQVVFVTPGGLPRSRFGEKRRAYARHALINKQLPVIYRYRVTPRTKKRSTLTNEALTSKESLVQQSPRAYRSTVYDDGSSISSLGQQRMTSSPEPFSVDVEASTSSSTAIDRRASYASSLSTSGQHSSPYIDVPNTRTTSSSSHPSPSGFGRSPSAFTQPPASPESLNRGSNSRSSWDAVYDRIIGASNKDTE